MRPGCAGFRWRRHGCPGVAATREGARRLLGRGAVPIWFSGGSGTLGAALLANSAATAALDLDDGYRRARGHPGAAVVPAALAMLTLRPALSADDILGAIVAGYEVALRVAMARLSYAPSGAWSAYGVIAALGYLQGTSLECLAHALAIAAQASPALPALAGLAGSDVKEGIPYGCLAGLAALEMAAAGATGPTDIFDIPTLFNGDVALADFGPAPLIEGTYFKPFGCCRHIHGALDAFLLLQREHGFSAEEIDGMEVATYRATFNLANRPAPTSLTDAQYSVPFCLAAAAIGGEAALLPLKQPMLSDPRIVRLARTVVVKPDPELETLFSGAFAIAAHGHPADRRTHRVSPWWTRVAIRRARCTGPNSWRSSGRSPHTRWARGRKKSCRSCSSSSRARLRRWSEHSDSTGRSDVRCAIPHHAAGGRRAPSCAASGQAPLRCAGRRCGRRGHERGLRPGAARPLGLRRRRR